MKKVLSMVLVLMVTVFGLFGCSVKVDKETFKQQNLKLEIEQYELVDVDRYEFSGFIYMSAEANYTMCQFKIGVFDSEGNLIGTGETYPNCNLVPDQSVPVTGYINMFSESDDEYYDVQVTNVLAA